MGKLDIALPKGHLQKPVFSLLDLAGYKPMIRGERAYSIECADPDIQFRIHRAQNIAPLVEEGKYDVGITGLDWIRESSTEVEELLDLCIGKVKIVAAIPKIFLENLPVKDEVALFDKYIEDMRAKGREKIIIASEYQNLTKKFCEKNLRKFPFRFITSYGATETFINVADMIVDCTQTGTTLRENGWEIANTLFESTARIIANKYSLQDRDKESKIEDFLSLVKGALDARDMKLLKMNVPKDRLKKIIAILPSMKSPTLSKLYSEKDEGYALEVAIKDDEVLQLIPLLKKNGATDILELDIHKVVR